MTKRDAQQLRLLADSQQAVNRFSAKWIARQPVPRNGLNSYDGIIYRAAFYALWCIGENPRWRGCNAQMTTFWWDGQKLQEVTMEELRSWEKSQLRRGPKGWTAR